MRPGPRAPAARAALVLALAVAPAAPPRDYVRVVDRSWLRVGLSVTVMDGDGRPVRGLRREDFRLFEDGEPVTIADFGVEGERADRPLSVAILLDLSRSMGRQVRQVREAATALLRGLRPGDEIMVAKFNDQVTILTPFTGSLDDPDRTLKNVGAARGGTALFRAIGEILRDLRERPGRKIIVVVSDGLDNDLKRGGHVLQSLHLQDLLRQCFRSATTVYGVRPGMAVTSWLPFESFVEESGGRLLYTGGDLEALFGRLGHEFQNQYHLAYDTDPKVRAGRRRSLRVEVARPGAIVRTIPGWSGSKGRLATLLRQASDDDPEVRSDALYELGFAADERATGALLKALADESVPVRRAAALSLGHLRLEAALPGLAAGLSDPDDAVRRLAAEALRRFGSGALPALAAEVSRAADRPPAPALIEAARLLGAIGDDRACAPLHALLGGHPEPVRHAAAEGLGALGLLCGLPALRGALADPAPTVRIAAARSLAAIAGEAARAVLAAHLKTEADPSVRAEVGSLLGVKCRISTGGDGS